MFEGDVVYPQFFGPQILLAPMATAIARIYTRQGFVVAADGRKRREDKGVRQIISDKVQKVFPFENDDIHLAYSMAGAVVITPEGQDDVIVFSLVDEIAKANELLAAQEFDSLCKYAESLSGVISSKLGAVKEIPFVKFPDGELQSDGESEICQVFVDGYLRNKPQRVVMRFAHKNQELQRTDVSTQELYIGHALGYGSAVVHDLVFSTQDKRFARYRMPYRSAEEIELRDAIEMARIFIEACKSPEAMQVDAKHCEGIGGHICIATVTPSNGFRWVKNHAPLAK